MVDIEGGEGDMLRWLRSTPGSSRNKGGRWKWTEGTSNLRIV